VLLIALMGRLFGSREGWIVEGVTFSQLCCDRSWKRTMAVACNESLVGGSGDHVRDVALIVAVKKVDCENDVYIFKRPDYTAEEWRWLFMTTRFQYVYFNIHTNKVFIIFFIFIYEIRRHCDNVYSVNIRLMKKDNKQFNFQDKSKKE
jgi:hypothetical protein